jgi:hypothetical protein
MVTRDRAVSNPSNADRDRVGKATLGQYRRSRVVESVPYKHRVNTQTIMLENRDIPDSPQSESGFTGFAVFKRLNRASG